MFQYFLMILPRWSILGTYWKSWFLHVFRSILMMPPRFSPCSRSRISGHGEPQKWVPDINFMQNKPPKARPQSGNKVEIHHHSLENQFLSCLENLSSPIFFLILEACQVYGQMVIEHSSKSTKYELQGSHGDPLYEHFRFNMFWRFIALPDESMTWICIEKRGEFS